MGGNMMTDIVISGAREGNLKNITLAIPRDKLIVFTGLSGSGKTTLAIDVLFQECQRQYLEAIGYQGINKPKIDSVRSVSPAIMIGQNESSRNPRSTVGTLTNIYTDLRMVYEKLGVRACPKCNAVISAAECREEVEKSDGDFKVFMYCSKCNHRMEKLTRTHFSHNTREGACKTCAGLGKVLQVDTERTIHETLSLEDGAVDFWQQGYKDYQIESLYSAFRHYGMPVRPNTPVSDFDPVQKAILCQGVESEAVRKAFPDTLPPKTVAGGRFEGVFSTLWRRISDKGGDARQLNEYFLEEVCPDCRGERLGALSRSVTVAGTRLPELSVLSLDELGDWVHTLQDSLPESDHSLVEPYLLDLATKIRRIMHVGLGYLSLDRQTITLSGGESQRIKLAAALDSDLTGMIYIMDEPTIGLHPKDTEGMITILKKLRDAGNTVIVIEHDPDMMQAADYIVDIGPSSGKHGGEIIGTGTLDELKSQPSSVTGAYLLKQDEMKRNELRQNGMKQREMRQQGIAQPVVVQPVIVQPIMVQPGRKRQVSRRASEDVIRVAHADLHNLQNIDVNFPIGCLNVVTGVSGSGKSTLVLDVIAGAANAKPLSHNIVSGLAQFDRVVTIEQSAVTKMKRSNVATFSEAYAEIRKIYGDLPESREKGFSAKHFSFNTPGGRCENCEGLGYIVSNMLFFKDIEVTCPVCSGRQFSDEVLSVKYKGCSIKEILQLSVEEALVLFREQRRIERILKLLDDVGLGYLELGQSVTTLSGGEGQRLKLARELIGNKGQHSLYLMDEPTTGLHPIDVEHFLALLNRMVDSGNTIIVVEHNQQVIKACDWITDLGPDGGRNGGQIVFTGTPQDMLAMGQSATAEYLRKSCLA